MSPFCACGCPDAAHDLPGVGCAFCPPRWCAPTSPGAVSHTAHDRMAALIAELTPSRSVRRRLARTPKERA